MSYLRRKADEDAGIPILQAVKEKFGFVPNLYRDQAARPDVIEAQVRLVEAALLVEGFLSRREKEYIFLACSAANLSTYCVTAHCEIVRMLGIEGPDPEWIAADYRRTGLPMAAKALLHFALKVNSQPPTVTRRDVDNLRVYGYTDEQIMETVVVVAVAKLANCISAGLGSDPDFDSSRLSLRPHAPSGARQRPNPSGISEPSPGM